MTLWLTSDLHLGHANILRYCPNRPFDRVWAMDWALVEAWNETVGVGDEVIVLGDMCMGNLSRSLLWVRKLHGSIRLVVGNHDKPFRRTGVPRPAWDARYLEAGFREIIHGETHLDIGLPHPVRACHFPYRGDSHAEDRYGEHRPVDDGTSFLLHGHTHGRWRRNGRMIDVGVDAWGGRPVAAEEVAGLCTTAETDAARLTWSLDT